MATPSVARMRVNIERDQLTYRKALGMSISAPGRDNPLCRDILKRRVVGMPCSRYDGDDDGGIMLKEETGE